MTPYKGSDKQNSEGDSEDPAISGLTAALARIQTQGDSACTPILARALPKGGVAIDLARRVAIYLARQMALYLTLCMGKDNTRLPEATRISHGSSPWSRAHALCSRISVHVILPQSTAEAFLMAVLDILEFPDPRLRTVATLVESVDEGMRALIEDMLETMYDASGIGLAATQVNVHKRLLVMDVSEERDQPMVFINPSVEVLDPELGSYDEGCLSVPGFYEEVNRPRQIRVTALDRNGESFTEELEGLAAICLQHEIDHLDGKLFVDYISPLKRQRIRRKLEKSHRMRA